VAWNPVIEHAGEPGASILRVGWSKAYREGGFHGGATWLAASDGGGPGKGLQARLAGSVKSSELR
jgi:hypothetical protein